MAGEQYKDYLATRVLAEHKPVTYRLLSRALKTNVNTAKRMLFEFHKTQNARKPKSVHATYLVTGTPRITAHANGSKQRKGGDTDMRSSPFMSSMPEPEENEDSDYATDSDDENTPAPKGVKETQVLLVREEELEETRAKLEEGASVHIYSLEPGPLETFGVLSLCNHEISTEHADVNPLERWKTYGLIQNQYIKRRTPQNAPPVTAKSTLSSRPAPKTTEKLAAKSADVKEKEPAAPAQKGNASEENASGRSTPQPSTGSSTLKRSDSKSGAKKDKATSDLFKSFAKAKPKAKESTPAPAEDEPMQGMSEDEGDPDDEPEVKIDEEKQEAARKAREERAERLRKMMEDDDEEMPDAAESQPETTPAATATADTPEPTEAETAVTVTNGRRRGRRRVMKKKKVKDEEGYLVTKEEAVWESFSEDEPVPKKAKPVPAKPASSAKGKNAGMKGQGSIASFFKKA